MGYKDVNYTTTSSSRNDEWVTDYEYFSFVAASDERSFDYDQLKDGYKNRWTYQSFYPDPPDASEDKKDQNSTQNRLRESEFKITYPSLERDQTDIRTDAHEPQSEDSSGSFSVDLSVAFGPISANQSLTSAYSGSTELDWEPNNSVVWTMKHGSSGQATMPTGNDNSIGVRFDLEAYENVSGEIDINFEDK
ncbi:hypothetical protein ACFQGT_00890 [Natrialbaceae archaeon GCM10025810]|uniref:hypothetical protein n=1 Tax=Halovalidus salilacus TaxID=3075124 RepID=UPI0036163514